MRVSVRSAGPVLVALVFAGLAFRLFRSTAGYAVNLFFWDQWDFNDATVFQKHSLWEIFRWQHGPHRQGLGGVFAALVEPWFHWDGRTEAFVACGLVVIAGLGMLLLKYRLFGALTWVDAAIPIVVFSPAQWESVWLTTNFAHGTMPLVLIVAYCLAWTRSEGHAKYLLIVALNFATLYTGFGLFAGLLTPALLLARYRAGGDRREFRVFLACCAAAAVLSLGSFFVQYQNKPASGCDSLFSPRPAEYFHFLDLMYAAFFGFRDYGPLATLAGGVAAAVTAAAALRGWHGILAGFRKAGPAQVVVAFLCGYSLLFCIACTLGRTCIGPADAGSSRYTDYLALGMLGLYFAGLTLRAPGWRALLPLGVLLALLPALYVPPSDTDMEDGFRQLKADWRECYLGGRSVGECDDDIGLIYPTPETTHLEEKLKQLRAGRLNLFAGAPGKHD